MLEDGIRPRADWLRAGKNKETAARFLRLAQGLGVLSGPGAACVDLVLKESPVLGRPHQAWMMAEINKLSGAARLQDAGRKMDPEAFKRTPTSPGSA